MHAMKRKSTEINDAEFCKVAKQAEEYVDRISELPPKALKNLARMLKAGDGDIKELIQVSKVFNETCLPRLTLRLDFDRIIKEGVYPVVARAYDEIKITGVDIDENELNLQEVLKSSRGSARKLHIGEDIQGCNGIMSQRALVTILRALPNVDDLVIQGMSIMKPLTRFSEIEFWDLPILSSLKKVYVHNCTGEVFSNFQRSQNLEELCVYVEKEANDNKERYELPIFVYKQQQLKSLRTNSAYALFGLEYAALPCLTTFVGPEIMHGVTKDSPANIFNIAPQLERFRNISAADNFSKDSLLMNNKSDHLTAIKTVAEVDNYFDIKQVRENFPSLGLFKSKNLVWRKPNIN